MVATNSTPDTRTVARLLDADPDSLRLFAEMKAGDSLYRPNCILI